MKPLPSSVLVLIATLSVQSLASMCLLTLPVVAPEVASDIGLSPAYLGIYIALAYTSAIVSSLMAGSAVRRFGALRCSQLGLVSSALGLFITAIPHPVATALGALAIGFGYGPITPASSHLLAKSTPAHRMSFVFSIKQTGVPLGGGLAGLIIPGLAGWTGWQWAFVAVGLVNLVCILLVQPLCAGLDADKDPSRKVTLGGGLSAPLKLVFRHRSLRALAGVSFMLSVCQLSVLTYMVTFLYEDLGMNLIQAGVAIAVAQAAGVIGRLAWGYVADRFCGSTRMLGILALLIIVCSVISPFLQQLDSTALVYLVLIVFGSSAIGWNGVYLAEVARQAPPGQAGVATGGTLALTFMGVVIGPPIFGIIAELTGSFGIAYATLVVPAGICLYLLLRFRSEFSPRKAPSL